MNEFHFDVTALSNWICSKPSVLLDEMQWREKENGWFVLSFLLFFSGEKKTLSHNTTQAKGLERKRSQEKKKEILGCHFTQTFHAEKLGLLKH